MQKAFYKKRPERLPSERRVTPRSDVEATVAYSFLQSISSRTYDATACNCSDDGLCIETSYPLSPEQYLSIRKNRTGRSAMDGKNGHLLKPYKVAQVQWCRPSKGEGRRRYQAGLRYC